MIQPVGIDLYPGDGNKDLRTFIAAGPPWLFAIFKLTQGLDYAYTTWAAAQRAPFVGSLRYGIDLFDGFYHYLTLHQSGPAQAEWFWMHMRRVGGEHIGTLWPMVDVERGGQRIPNPSRTLVEDRVRSFAARLEDLSGRSPTLYGGELLRSVGVTDRLGCGRSAVAGYGSELRRFDRSIGRYVGSTAEYLAGIGTDLSHLMLWQYRGTEATGAGPASYPMTAPGCGAVDISALTLPGGLAGLRSGLWTEDPG